MLFSSPINQFNIKWPNKNSTAGESNAENIDHKMAAKHKKTCQSQHNNRNQTKYDHIFNLKLIFVVWMCFSAGVYAYWKHQEQ